MLRVNPTDGSLSERLRAAREAASLSQLELALEMGVSRRTVQGWEAGRSPQPRHRRLVLAFIGRIEEAAA